MTFKKSETDRELLIGGLVSSFSIDGTIEQNSIKIDEQLLTTYEASESRARNTLIDYIADKEIIVLTIPFSSGLDVGVLIKINENIYCINKLNYLGKGATVVIKISAFRHIL
ncbi:MAG: hypothetical protein U9N52_04885 [Campylobacterota bacterium]|nr:hypothetical protein [Campylobacterota bacterium]